MRAYTQRLLSFTIKCAMIIAMTFGLSFSAGQSLAQDITPEAPAAEVAATVVPTEQPTEVPTEAPTEVSTEVSTEAPTEQPTEVIVTSVPTDVPTLDISPTAAVTDEATIPAPTEAPTVVTPVVTVPDVFTEDFQDGETSGWLLTSGWALAEDSGNTILAAATPNETAMLTGVSWPYYTLSFRVFGTVQLNLTSGGSTYGVSIAADGAAALYKDSVLLGQSAGAPPTDGTAEPIAVWHTVNVLAPGHVLAVKVDDFAPISISDPLLMGMGPLVFGTEGTNTAAAAIDDLSITRLDAPPPAPTVEPTLALGTLPPPSDVTAEPTAETTVEVTVEATAEATVEATAEATVEVVGLTEAAQGKLPYALVDILNTYVAGDVTGAEAAAKDYFITVDNQQRIVVTIWAANETAAAAVAGAIPAIGGVLTSASSVQLQALVSLEGLLALANSPDVSLIELPPRAVSTSNRRGGMEVQGTGQGTGTEVSEGLDSTGATAWHLANIKGAGVGIAVIDTGFGYGTNTTAPVTASGEYACLFNNTINGAVLATPTDTTHGLSMVEVLCDMAPAAKVYMYKATNASELENAILNAKNSAAIKVVVIALDLGASVSPGDGTGGGVINSLYTEISNARAAGKIVIASAGNSTGRYLTLDYTGTGQITMPVNVFPGDTIHLSWNDWAGTLNGATLEVFNGNIGGSAFGGVRIASPLTPPRFTIPVSTGDCADTVNGCAKTLTINNVAGNGGAVAIQVQITGQGTVGGTATGASVSTVTGTIARPADSQDVIAVGAVCPDDGVQLFLDSFSSHGPVFAAGGGLPTPLASYTRDQVKPDLVGPTHVSISGSVAAQQGCNNATGLNGTSAAAAHIAGMAALMVSNTNTSMTAFDGTTSAAVDAVQNYMQTHTIDNTVSAGFAVGYDNSYGAGYTMLGSPTYNIGQIAAVAVAADALPASCATPLYVGLYSPNSSQDGTLSNPYISINEALAKATATQCVVVLPGEYVAQIYAGTSTLAPAILSYKSATSFGADPSIPVSSLWSVIQSPIFIDDNDIIVDGFVAQRAGIMVKTSDGLTVRSETPAFRIRASTNAVIQNTLFASYKLPAVVRDSSGVTVKGNTFTGFAIPSRTTGVFISPVTFTAALEITASTTTLVQGNVFSINSLGTTNNTPSPWQPSIVGIRYSGVKLYNNQFNTNTASAIIGIDQWEGSVGSSNRRTDEVQFVGNLFNGNTINGPLVHLFAASNMRFVNNTAVNNVMNGTSNFNGFFIYGIAGSTTNNIDGALEIHNNLFYNNKNSTGTTRPLFLETAENAANIGCDAIGAGAPARNNWFDAVIGASSSTNTRPGECSDVGKIINSIDETITPATTFFGSSFDPLHPFRLRPTDSSIINLKSGINTGDNQALIDIFGTDVNTGYLKQVDLRGSNRVIMGANPNLTYQTTTVDVGAYELGVANAPVANAITRTIAEDSSTSVVFLLTADGGYTQTFALTTLPTEYDTNPSNACLGQAVRFTAPNIVTYCPPAQFHTQYGAGDTDVPVTIGFTVEDKIFKPGELSTSTISLTITPVDDGTPTAASFNILSDYVTPIVKQLNPIYQLGNFVVSGTGGSVDFPFTYAFDALGSTDNPSLLGGTSNTQVLQDAFDDANTNGGKLLINPVAGQKGYVTFTYTVTDRDNDVGTGTITVVIQPTLAQDGTFDDASFNFTYNGTGWGSSFVTGAYNNSLHASAINTDSVEIPFAGSVVRFNLRGSTSASSTLDLAFKLDLASGGASTYQSYDVTKTTLGAGFTCINSLNGAQPNPSSDVSNYSPTGAAYTITCSGFPTGQAHSIKITNNAGGSLTLDSADISAGVMTAGKSYQETSANLTYTGMWVQNANPAALGGARRYTNDANGKVSFNVDSSVGRLVIYRTTYLAGVYGSMQVYVGGVLKATINNTSPTFLFGQPFVLNITPANQTVEIRNVGATFSDIDQIDALPVAQTLSVGTYQETYSDLTYSGVWTSFVGAGPLGGSVRYTNTPNGSVTFKVDATVGRVIIYRTTYSIYGSTNVYVDGATTPYATITNTSAAYLFAQPYVLTLTPGNHTIELRNIGSTYSSLDQLTLLAPVQPLVAATGTYQETDANLSYSGIWTSNATPSALGGARRFTNDPNASVSFKIDSSVSRVVIYRTTYLTGVYGSMQVFLDTSTTPIATINNTSATMLFGQPFLINIASPGSHTITIKNVGTTYSDIDQIQVLGPTSYLGIGNYQENDFNLTYNGVWTTNLTPSALGGSRLFTNQNGASVSFKINSSVSRVVIYRTTYLAGVYGSMQVFLDTNNSPIATINNTSSGFQFGQAYIIPIAVPDDHIITIKNVGTTYSDIDQITLVGAPQSLTATPGSYQETDLNLTYSGVWTPNVTTSALGGSRRFTNDATASVSFTIDDSVKRMVIYRTTGLVGVYGSMRVKVNGSTVVTINNTSPAMLFGQPFMVTIPSPADGTLITLENVGSTYSDLDRIDLLDTAADLTETPGVYQENNPNLTYTGHWVHNVNTSTLGGARRYTNETNASVSFDIGPNVTRVVIYRTIYQAGVYGSMGVYLDGNNTPTTTINNNTSSTFLYGQAVVVPVPAGGHTVTIKNLGPTYSDIDQIVLLTSGTVLTAGAAGSSYQDNHPDLTYTGTWTLNSTGSALGGSRRFTNDPNAKVSFTVDNSVGRIIIYRTTFMAGVYGSMDVYVNGSKAATINSNTSSTMLFGQPFVLPITPANQTIEIRNTGSTYIDLDQIDLLPQAQELVVGDYQDTDINLTYSGVWTPNSAVGALGGTRRFTNDANGKVSFNIDATVGRVVIYRTTYLTGVYGSMQVYAGGVLKATIDNTSASFLYGQPYEVLVTPGDQTIEIRNVGTTYSDIDQITLLGPRDRLVQGTTFQETEPNLTYSGKWTQNAAAGALSGARRYTNDPNGKVSFDIDATVGRIVIYRSTYLTGVYGSMQVYADGVLKATINNTSTAFLFGQPYVVTVTPGNQTIEIRNVGATYSDIDQIALLGPRDRLTPGTTLQEKDFNLTYTGLWTQNAAAPAFGGERRFTNDSTAKVSFDIDSNVARIVVYRTKYLTGVYGSMGIYLNGVLKGTIDNTSTVFQYGQPFFLNIPLADRANQTVEIRNVGTTYSDIDQIVLLGDPATLTTAQIYEETNSAFSYTGQWTSVAGSGPSGNAAYYSYTNGASVTFKFTGTAFTLYRVMANGAGGFSVNIDGNIQNFDNSSLPTLWQQSLDFSGLTNTTHTVVITKTGTAPSNFLYFDAIRIVDTTAPLTVGQYQETYAGLTYTGAWTQNATSKSTTTVGNTLTFKFTGTGFGFITANTTATGTMTVSCTISSGPNVCGNPNPTPVNGGYTFYNLKEGTYDVTITYTGSGGLFIDRIYVLGVPPTVMQAGTYEDSSSAIVYSPNDLWTTVSSANYSGGTSRVTTQKGAVMQVRFIGGTMVLYQVAAPGIATNMNVCLRLTDAAGNPTSLCTTYSQRAASTTTFVAPVAFYGFGSGTHDVIIENPTQGVQFNIDKILIN